MQRVHHAFPEVHWLGVRVVHSENLHAVCDPQAEQVVDRFEQAFRIVIEVNGVDVLVLLGRILRIRDGAVGSLREPFGMVPDPRVIR